MIVCPQCGKSFPEDESFCASCGYAAPKVGSPSPDAATNPYAVGTQTTNSPASYDGIAREVPDGFWEAVKTCFRRGGVKGRASRSEFWRWILFVFLTVVLPISGGVFFNSTLVWRMGFVPKTAAVLLVAGAVVILAGIVWGIVCAGPTFTVTVRRFHDVGLPGFPPYLFLIDLALLAVAIAFGSVVDPISVVVPIIFLVFLAALLLFVFVVSLLPGTKGENKYGPPPINRAAVAEDKTYYEVSQ